MSTAYASLEDIWGEPSFATQQPAVPENIYKSRQYQSKMLRKQQQQQPVPWVPPAPAATPDPLTAAAAQLYNALGARGLLKHLPAGAAADLRGLLCGKDEPGVLRLRMPSVDMQSLVSVLLCGFVALLIADVLSRFRR